MNRTIEIWTEGCKVFGRVVVFSLIVGILSLPIQFLLQSVTSFLASEENGMKEILLLGTFILVYPFIFWLASDFTGYFKGKNNKVEAKRVPASEEQSKAEQVD